MTWPCVYKGRLFGIVGFDVPVGDVVESAAYYSRDGSYAFVMDRRGSFPFVY